jgi:hypothetical protein
MYKESAKVAGLFRLLLRISDMPTILLILVLIVASVLRFSALGWDSGAVFHPGERQIIEQSLTLQASDGFRVQSFETGGLLVYLYRISAQLLSVPSFYHYMFSFEDEVDLLLQWRYWFSLALIIGVILWVFSRERWKALSFVVSLACFLAVLFTRILPIFGFWFKQFSGATLVYAYLLSVFALGLSLLGVVRRRSKPKRLKTNCYLVVLAMVALGVASHVLREHVLQWVVTLTFTLVLALLAGGLSWISRWGRSALVMICFVALLLDASLASPSLVDRAHLVLIGRTWSAFFSVGSIALLFILVKRLYGSSGLGVLAAVFLCCSLLSVQAAHFATPESFLTMMVVVIALMAERIARRGSGGAYLLAGLAYGLALAGDPRAVSYVLLILAGHLIYLGSYSYEQWRSFDRRDKPYRLVLSICSVALIVLIALIALFVVLEQEYVIADLFSDNPARASLIWGIFWRFAFIGGFLAVCWCVVSFKALRAQLIYWLRLVGLIVPVTFICFLFSPWSFLEWGEFSRASEAKWRLVTSADALSFAGFQEGLRYWHQLSGLVRAGLWWPLGIVVSIGFVMVLVKVIRQFVGNRFAEVKLSFAPLSDTGFGLRFSDLLLLAWFLPYSVFVGTWKGGVDMYLVVFLPFFCVFGARLLGVLFRWCRSERPACVYLLGLFVVGVIVSGLTYSIAHLKIWSKSHPWIDASYALYVNAPPKAEILTDAIDVVLPQQMGPVMDQRMLVSMSPNRYQRSDLNVYQKASASGDDSFERREYLVDRLIEGQYLILPHARSWYFLSDLSPDFHPKGYAPYPLASRFYRLLWSGLLGYEMIAQYGEFPPGFRQRDSIGDSYAAYLYPRVHIFKKVRDVSRQALLDLLASDYYVDRITRGSMSEIGLEQMDRFIADHTEFLGSRGIPHQSVKMLIDDMT